MFDPTFSSAALGFRLWFVTDGGDLLSTGAGRMVWRPGVNLAYCSRHVAPAQECGCGLYAYYDLEGLAERYHLACPKPFEGQPFLAGAVAARGQSMAHHDGFRAEEAAILALAIPEGSSIDSEQAREVAEHYGVPLVSYEDLASTGLQYALPAPEEIRPGVPTPAPQRQEDPPRNRREAFCRGARRDWMTEDTIFTSIVLCMLPVAIGGLLHLYSKRDIGDFVIVAVALLGVLTVVSLDILSALTCGMREYRYWYPKNPASTS